jgi:hypothetical protein
MFVRAFMRPTAAAIAAAISPLLAISSFLALSWPFIGG